MNIQRNLIKFHQGQLVRVKDAPDLLEGEVREVEADFGGKQVLLKDYGPIMAYQLEGLRA